MAIKKTVSNRGPGLLYIIAALVVVAVAGARFFGFAPSADVEDPGALDNPPRVERPMDQSGVVPDPSKMTQVLVYHTHGTENYSPKDEFSTKGPGDVISVGNALVEALRREGIESVHIQTVHDLPEWNQAYAKTRTSLQESLARHSGIRLLIDVHRDGVQSDAEGYATATVNGESVAKVLFVVGSTDNPLATENLRYAERLRERLEEMAPGITRGVRVMARETNQDIHPNTLIAYVGDHNDSTIEEAMRTAELLANAVASLLREDG